MCDLLNLNWFYDKSQLVNWVSPIFAVTGQAGITVFTEVTPGTTRLLYLMCHLTTVVFAMMHCVGTVGPVVIVMFMLVVMVLSLMVVRLFPLTTPGAVIRASTDAEHGKMPTFALPVTFSCFSLASVFAFLIVPTITLSFQPQFASLQ